MRHYTCRADTHLICLVIDQENYQTLTASAEMRKDLELVTYLRSLPLFKKMSLSNLRKFSHHLKPFNCIIHHVLYKEATPASQVFLVLSGEFRITKRVTLDKKEKKISHVDIYEKPHVPSEYSTRVSNV